MATPRNSTQRTAPRPSGDVTYNRNDPNHVLVDPRWLARIFGMTILAAFVCAYLLMCVLFRVGSWQWVLHPTQKASAGTGLPGEVVHFGPDASGNPQLTGEWMPVAPTAGGTVIYLRPGDGQLDFADAPVLRMLHDENKLNVLAFDYRGYGRSAAKPHPTEERMQQDAEAAWKYVTELRGVPADLVVIYGAGTGASLATRLVQAHPDAAAIIMRNATADVLGTIRDQKRARFFPVTLLLKDRFGLQPLATLRTPKLLLDVGSDPRSPEYRARVSAYAAAADPKMTVTLPTDDPIIEQQSLRRFLDERTSVLQPPSELLQFATPQNNTNTSAQQK